MAEKSFWNEKKDKEWVSNFFFYYSKHIFAISFILIIVVSTCVSCLNEVNYDLEIYYLSNTNLATEVFSNTELAVSELIDDADGKDGKTVLVQDFAFDAEDTANAQFNMSMSMKASLEMSKGNGYLYIMTDNWLTFCEKNEFLEDISMYTGDENSPYCIEITDNRFMNDLGFKNDAKLYVGVRVLDADRKENKIDVSKHNNAVNVLKYIIENN